MTDQKVLPIMPLVIFAATFIIYLFCNYLGGFSSAMNKENIEVAYALLILRIVIFNILKFNV